MRPQLVMTFATIFIGGTLLACIASGTWLLNGEINVINALASFNTVNIQTGGGWAIPKGLISFFSALITALAWDYPFLSSPWAIFIKIPLWVVSIGVVWGLIETFIQAAQGIIASLRNLFGLA